MLERHQKWLDFYLGEANFNATEAARRTGYKNPKLQGFRLKEQLHEEIQRNLDERCLTSQQVLARLSEQALGIGPYLHVNGENQRVYVDMEALEAAGLKQLVKSVKETKYGQEIEFYDAQAALVQIGRHHKLFTDKAELTGKDGEPLVIGYRITPPSDRGTGEAG